MRVFIGLLMAVGVVLALAGCTFDGAKGCVSDESCRDGRICWDGACTSEMRYTAVAAGKPCAVTVEGELECWGGRYDPDADAGIRVDVPTESGFVDVASGIFNACGLKEDGRAICFGVVQMGAVPSGLRFAQIALHHRPGCGVTVDGILVCWDGSSEDYETIEGQYRSVSVHGLAWCAVTADDQLYCRQDEYLEVPEMRVKDANINWAREGNYRTYSLCVLDLEHKIKCFGVEPDRDDVLLEMSGEFESMTSSHRYACGLKEDGRVECQEFEFPEVDESIESEDDSDSEDDSRGPLPGAETEELNLKPPEGVRFESIDGGAGGVCGITVDGRVRCWGRESFAR